MSIMSTTAVSRAFTRSAVTPATAAPGANAAPAAIATQDSFVRSAPSAADPLTVLNQAVALPPQPQDPAAQKAWLLDGYSRFIKADAARQALETQWGNGKLDGETYGQAADKVDALQDALKAADGDGSVKREFYAGVIKPSQALINSLKSFPAAPADRAGKQAWLAKAQQQLAKANAAEDVITDAWMQGGVSFDTQGRYQSAVADFEFKVMGVQDQLHPPAPSKGGNAGGNSLGIMGNTIALGNFMQKNQNPVAETAGAIALPFAAMLDTIDLITKPFQLLSGQK